MVCRREILKTAMVLAAGQLSCIELAAGAASPAAPAAPAPAGPNSTAATGTGPAKPFDYAWLKGQARFLAGSPFQDVL
jgi:glucan biosynthesis protein